MKETKEIVAGIISGVIVLIGQWVFLYWLKEQTKNHILRLAKEAADSLDGFKDIYMAKRGDGLTITENLKEAVVQADGTPCVVSKKKDLANGRFERLCIELQALLSSRHAMYRINVEDIVCFLGTKDKFLKEAKQEYCKLGNVVREMLIQPIEGRHRFRDVFLLLGLRCSSFPRSFAAPLSHEVLGKGVIKIGFDFDGTEKLLSKKEPRCLWEQPQDTEKN